ncbi:MAG: 1-acyl-sn-glycerol-3-phosphate acyltransferase [Ilumatobacteraceae bacterium]
MKRRLLTIPGLYLGGCLLVFLAPLWVVIGLVIDLAARRFRFPIVRLLAFAVCWAWLEIVGVTASGIFWVTGQRRNRSIHYALQRWWAARLLGALRLTCGVRIQVENVEALRPGPAILLARHASLADSLVSAYVVTTVAGMNPRYVLKRELLGDPCLDIVGQRLPNHFVIRDSPDSSQELKALEDLVADLDQRSVGIIFPEGTRANPIKRRRALEKLTAQKSDRVQTLEGLRHLLPPRPAGTVALLRGSQEADVVLGWHVGFEGLDTFGGILRALAQPFPPVRFVLRRVPRADVPSVMSPDGSAFVAWLDEQWVALDAEVDQALQERHS